MQIIICCLFMLASYVLADKGRPKCLVTSPYNLRDVDTLLAIKDCTKELQGWYTGELSILIERNGGSTDPNVLNPALNRFFKVYCEPPNFKGFVGITGTGQLFTNLSDVKALYSNQVTIAGPGATFNVDFYSENIVVRPDSRNRQVVYANLTAHNRHHIEVANGEGGKNFMIVMGYYINEWRIDASGNGCISRFHDSFLKIFKLPQTTLLSIPWDLNL